MPKPTPLKKRRSTSETSPPCCESARLPSLYKYGLNREINAAEQRQQENIFFASAAIEQDYFKGQIRQLREELEQERQRNRALVGQVAIMEANAARLGFDPEELRKALLKPIRTITRAGGSKGKRSARPF